MGMIISTMMMISHSSEAQTAKDSTHIRAVHRAVEQIKSPLATLSGNKYWARKIDSLEMAYALSLKNQWEGSDSVKIWVGNWPTDTTIKFVCMTVQTRQGRIYGTPALPLKSDGTNIVSFHLAEKIESPCRAP